MQNKKQAFTLVELIVVITILAILGTIAFISLQGYSSQARDSKRVSDIQNIKKSLELFSLNTGKYPEPDDYFTVSYGSQALRYQGIVGEQVSTNLSRNLNEKPVDPLTGSEYTYSRTYGGTEYEVLSIYESDLIVTSPLFFAKATKSRQPSPLRGEGARPGLFSSSYAAPSSGANYPKINGNYNGVYVKAGNYYVPTPSIINALNIDLDLEVTSNGLESQIITGGDNNIANAGNEASTGGLSGMTVEVFTGELNINIGEDTNNGKVLLAHKLIKAFNGTTLANAGIYKEIVETAGRSNLINLIDNTILNEDIYGDNTSSNGVLITQLDCSEAGWYWINETEDTMGNGYCISPRIEGNGDTYGISWNDSGTTSSWRGWSSTGYSTLEGSSTDLYGISAYFSDYTCGAINNNHIDVDDTYGDTIKGRMKWLSEYANMNDNYSDLNNIDWININLNTSNIFPIPAIYIADCIDGVKDLTISMLLGEEVISWNDYISTENEDTTRTARNKYLLGWSKDSGSHLPSAYSTIDSETTDNLTGDARGEYQVACELLNTDNTTDFYSSVVDSNGDKDNLERIWLGALGNIDGAGWGRYARTIGFSGCGVQTNKYVGIRATSSSARFVVRP